MYIYIQYIYRQRKSNTTQAHQTLHHTRGFVQEKKGCTTSLEEAQAFPASQCDKRRVHKVVIDNITQPQRSLEIKASAQNRLVSHDSSKSMCVYIYIHSIPKKKEKYIYIVNIHKRERCKE